MARMRVIKPGFFSNDLLSELDPLGRLLFVGLWLVADREGRLEDRPKKLKAEILPYDSADANALLDALQEKGFIVRYQSNGARYIQVINFTKHQQPHHKEVASAIPAPEDQGDCAPINSATTEEQTGSGEAGPEATQTDTLPDSSLTQARANVEPTSGQAQPDLAHFNYNYNFDFNRNNNLASHGADAPSEEIPPEVNPPPAKPEPSRKEGKPRDTRLDHPAIKAAQSACSRCPPKELRDSLIAALGEGVDAARLNACRAEWLKRGFNPMSWTWAIDWYKDGIPPIRRNGDGSPKNHRAINAANSTTEEFVAAARRIYDERNGTVIDAEVL